MRRGQPVEFYPSMIAGHQAAPQLDTVKVNREMMHRLRQEPLPGPGEWFAIELQLVRADGTRKGLETFHLSFDGSM